MSRYPNEVRECVKSDSLAYEVENAVISAPRIEADVIRLKNCKIEGTEFCCDYAKFENVSGHITDVYSRTNIALADCFVTFDRFLTQFFVLERSFVYVVDGGHSNVLNAIDSRLAGKVITRDARIYHSLLIPAPVKSIQYPLEIGYNEDGVPVTVTAYPWLDNVTIGCVGMSFQEALEHFKDMPEDLEFLKRLHEKAARRGKVYEQVLRSPTEYEYKHQSVKL